MVFNICKNFKTIPSSSKNSKKGDKILSTDRQMDGQGETKYTPLKFVCRGIISNLLNDTDNKIQPNT